MSGNVFVQAVSTIWTKASRGAPQSAVRNRLPDAFALCMESPSVEMFLEEPAKCISDLAELW
jgi:hypothetical protein